MAVDCIVVILVDDILIASRSIAIGAAEIDMGVSDLCQRTEEQDPHWKKRLPAERKVLRIWINRADTMRAWLKKSASIATQASNMRSAVAFFRSK